MAVDDLILIEALIELNATKNTPVNANDIEEKLGKMGKGSLDVHTIRRRMRKLVGFKPENYTFEEGEKWFEAPVFGGKGNIHFKVSGKNKEIRGYYYEGGEANVLDCEMLYCIDSVLYSKVLSKSEKNALIDDLLRWSGKSEIGFLVNSYRDQIKDETYKGNSNVLKNVMLIQEAIKENKKIKFDLYTYIYEDGEVKVNQSSYRGELFVVSPHAVTMSNGRYYLLAYSVEQKDKNEFRIYRIDLMRKLEKLKNQARETNVPKMLNNKYLSKYILESPYMYGGELEEIAIEIEKNQFTQFVDWFGDRFKSIEENPRGDIRKYKIVLEANSRAFMFWAMQYAQFVTIVSPLHLVQKMHQRLTETIDRYNTILDIEKMKSGQ